MGNNVPKVKNSAEKICIDEWGTMGNNGEQMSTEKLDADIKTRVEPRVKRAFEQLARDRHLDVADVAREAFREYLEKHPIGQNDLPLMDKQPKAVAA